MDKHIIYLSGKLYTWVQDKPWLSNFGNYKKSDSINSVPKMLQ